MKIKSAYQLIITELAALNNTITMTEPMKKGFCTVPFTAISPHLVDTIWLISGTRFVHNCDADEETSRNKILYETKLS